MDSCCLSCWFCMPFSGILTWHGVPQEKEKIKQERDTAEAKYKVAYVDDRPEPVRHFQCMAAQLTAVHRFRQLKRPAFQALVWLMCC